MLFPTASCGDKNAAAADSLAMIDTLAPRLYMLQQQGRYADYVNAMASAEGQPESYRQMLQLAVKHHAAEIKRTKKGIKSVKFSKKEVYDNGRMLKAFLDVTYGDNTTEEIILPLVKSGEQWKLQ